MRTHTRIYTHTYILLVYVHTHLLTCVFAVQQVFGTLPISGKSFPPLTANQNREQEYLPFTCLFPTFHRTAVLLSSPVPRETRPDPPKQLSLDAPNG